MKRSYIALAIGTLVAIGTVLSLPSCGHDQVLTAVTINPSGASITGTGVIVNFQAIGTYIHPPESKDITTSVVWTSAAPQIVSIVSNTGVATSGAGCGSNITITATHYTNTQAQSGSVVVGTAAVSVTQVPACP
jgi:hypothetical protein